MSHGNIYSPDQWAFIDSCVERGWKVTVSNEPTFIHHGARHVNITTINAHPARTCSIKSMFSDRFIERINGAVITYKVEAGPPPLYGDPGPEMPKAPIAMLKANGEPCAKCHKPMETFGRCASCGNVPGKFPQARIRSGAEREL